jgi:hypothetical protein
MWNVLPSQRKERNPEQSFAGIGCPDIGRYCTLGSIHGKARKRVCKLIRK